MSDNPIGEFEEQPWGLKDLVRWLGRRKRAKMWGCRFLAVIGEFSSHRGVIGLGLVVGPGGFTNRG